VRLLLQALASQCPPDPQVEAVVDEAVVMTPQERGRQESQVRLLLQAIALQSQPAMLPRFAQESPAGMAVANRQRIDAEEPIAMMH